MKVGDTVKLKPAMWQGIKPESYGLSFTGEYVVNTYFENHTHPSVKLEGVHGIWDAKAFQAVKLETGKEFFKRKVEEDYNEDLSPKEKSIERPILGERKIGKIRMELFDEGFPNAILEVAKVMTWASENKGYKDHDWVNLPNADSAFSAAASRHKLKGIIQKLNGVEVLQRTDEESNILHLAHACFNCLAELELVLRGKIK